MKHLVPFLLVIVAACHKVPDVLPTTVTTFRATGLDVSWDQSGSNRIAYTIKETDTYYDIHFANPDGTNDTCLTCNHPSLPNRHISNMFWHNRCSIFMLGREDVYIIIRYEPSF